MKQMKLVLKLNEIKRFCIKGKRYFSFLFIFFYILAIFFLFFYNDFHFFSVKQDRSLSILEVEAKAIETEDTTINEIQKKVLSMNPSISNVKIEEVNTSKVTEQASASTASQATPSVPASSPAPTTSPAWPTGSCGYISNNFASYHDGIDIAGCPYNSNIYAAMSGTVVTVSTKYDNGLYIVIQHDNGQYTMYAHLANAYVSVGQRVETAQVIAGMGRSGNATGVHLHFSLWTAYPYIGSALSPWQLY